MLEIGCGRGGNLLPMAASLPDARLLGIDRSRGQIEEAANVARQAGVTNAGFERATIESFTTTDRFDYVLCHGVASWVSAETRCALLALVERSLVPGGIAYVSFNVLPGWYEKLAARDWLRTFPADDARASLAWLRDAVSPELADYRRRLELVGSRLAEAGATYAAHEYLAGEHHPQHVSSFLAEAGRAGLDYLGDGIPQETALELLPEAVGRRAEKLEADEVLQLVDFVRNTAFRRTLLVRTADARARGWRWPMRLRSEAARGLRVASRFRPHDAEDAGAASERFDATVGSVQVAERSTRVALHRLAEVAPRSLPFDEVACEELFDLWLSTGGVDLHVREPPLGDGLSTHPAACPVARWHAVHGGTVTNRWHQEVLLSDEVLLRVLALLDGSRSIEELGTLVGRDLVRPSLRALGAAALLVR